MTGRWRRLESSLVCWSEFAGLAVAAVLDSYSWRLGKILGMDTEDVRQSLQQEEHRLTGLRDELIAGDELGISDQMQSGGEASLAGQHPADAATDTQQREIDSSTIEQIEAEIADVERALVKLDDGSYGRCEVCNNEIGAERLAALPATRFCIDHAGATTSSTRVENNTSPI